MSLAACGEANDTEFATTRTGGRKKCRIKRGGRKRPSARETPPRRAGRGFSIGGRDFHFLLWQVAGIRKFRKNPQCFALSQGGSRRWFSEILQKSTRGSFFTLWDQVGGQFFLCPYSHHNTGGSKRGYAQNLMRRKQRRSTAIKCTSVSNEKAVCNSSDFLLCLCNTPGKTPPSRDAQKSSSYSCQGVVWCVATRR